MAKKKSTKASTPKSEGKKVQRAPLSNTAIRFVGFLIAFLGIMFIMKKGGIVSSLLNVVSVFLLLWGLYLVSGSIKKLSGTTTDKNKIYLNLMTGLLMMVAGILLLVYGDDLASYFPIIAGCCIGVYGILMLVRFLCSGRSRKATFGAVMGALTMVVGILICLLYVPDIANASNGVCYIVFGSFATAVGALEIICY